mmetsp:Transcript_12758/g.22388  ORF Transcript_12758/g.22388 Transcript_12758/m.22388 type:complete len:241 (-) Transcript_12758:920-1642(-)
MSKSPGVRSNFHRSITVSYGSMCVSWPSSRRACPAMPAPTTREEDRDHSLRSWLALLLVWLLPLARELPPEELTRLCVWGCAPWRSATRPSSKNAPEDPSSPRCCCDVNFFTAPSSSFTRPSNPRHRSVVNRLLSVLANAHSCNATTLASNPSTYSLSDLALCMTSIPSAARLFASTADWVTRLISSCISVTMASFSRRLRSACSVSILDMRSSSWRLVSVFFADCCSFSNVLWACSRLL